MSALILLVEDNPSDEKLTIQAFKRCGVPSEIIVERDGVLALDYLLGRERFARGPMPAQPSLVLLDLKLPRVDGIEVLRAVRSDRRTKLLPVVVLTASGEDEDIVRAYEAGANAYVRKPVEFTDFEAAARTVALFWLGLSESPTARGRSR